MGKSYYLCVINHRIGADTITIVLITKSQLNDLFLNFNEIAELKLKAKNKINNRAISQNQKVIMYAVKPFLNMIEELPLNTSRQNTIKKSPVIKMTT